MLSRSVTFVRPPTSRRSRSRAAPPRPILTTTERSQSRITLRSSTRSAPSRRFKNPKAATHRSAPARPRSCPPSSCRTPSRMTTTRAAQASTSIDPAPPRMPPSHRSSIRRRPRTRGLPRSHPAQIRRRLACSRTRLRPARLGCSRATSSTIPARPTARPSRSVRSISTSFRRRRRITLAQTICMS